MNYIVLGAQRVMRIAKGPMASLVSAACNSTDHLINFCYILRNEVFLTPTINSLLSTWSVTTDSGH